MKKYRSSILRMVHEDAEVLYKIGAFDAKEMHRFDVDCLVPSAVPIRETSSNKSGVSQNSGSRPGAPVPAVAAARA